jgi:hypothetical protein
MHACCGLWLNDSLVYAALDGALPVVSEHCIKWTAKWTDDMDDFFHAKRRCVSLQTFEFVTSESCQVRR